MDATMKKAYAEVYDIICNMELDLYEKIPDEFLGMIEENMDKNYTVDIDYELGINNQNLLSETKSILALIYRNFICDEEEKKVFDQMQQEKKQAEQVIPPSGSNSLEERFSALGINKTSEKVSKEEVMETAITAKPMQESFLKKILNFFKRKNK